MPSFVRLTNELPNFFSSSLIPWRSAEGVTLIFFCSFYQTLVDGYGKKLVYFFLKKTSRFSMVNEYTKI
ncbi:hypothetical protein A0O00_10235 [Proteus mirabilis]|nr:hypothetical protein A0O00_10235 [Proteus mirabilis]